MFSSCLVGLNLKVPYHFLVVFNSRKEQTLHLQFALILRFKLHAIYIYGDDAAISLFLHLVGDVATLGLDSAIGKCQVEINVVMQVGTTTLIGSALVAIVTFHIA